MQEKRIPGQTPSLETKQNKNELREMSQERKRTRRGGVRGPGFFSTYRISRSRSARKAPSSMQLMWLLSSCLHRTHTDTHKRREERDGESQVRSAGGGTNTRLVNERVRGGGEQV